MAAAEAWLLYLRDHRRLSNETVRTYRAQLRNAFRELPDTYSHRDLLDAIDVRLGKGVTAHTRRNAWIVLKHFFSYWQLQGGPENPLAQSIAPPKPRKRRRGLTPVELEMLSVRIRSASSKDRCAVMLMLFQGFREGDVVNLLVEDVDFGEMTIRCRDGKGGRDDVLPMGPTVAEALRDYLEFNRIAAGHVFTGPKGPMHRASIWKAWRRVAGPKLMGLAPHQLRHSYATLLLRGQSHADIKTVQRLMRHRSLATTQLYLDEDPALERAAILNLHQHLGGFGT